MGILFRCGGNADDGMGIPSTAIGANIATFPETSTASTSSVNISPSSYSAKGFRKDGATLVALRTFKATFTVSNYANQGNCSVFSSLYINDSRKIYIDNGLNKWSTQTVTVTVVKGDVIRLCHNGDRNGYSIKTKMDVTYQGI